MSDEQVRALERRFRESGTDDDARAFVAALRRLDLPAAELLARCLEAGVTTPRRAELLAWLGDPAAAALLEGRERALLTAREVGDVFDAAESTVRGWGCPTRRVGRRVLYALDEVLRWQETHAAWRLPMGNKVGSVFVRGCEHWEPRAGVRAALALARSTQVDADEARLLDAVAAWVRRPSREALAALGDAVEGTERTTLTLSLVRGAVMLEALPAEKEGREAARRRALKQLGVAADEVVRRYFHSVLDLTASELLPAMDAAYEHVARDVRTVLRAALGPWALYRDEG